MFDLIRCTFLGSIVTWILIFSKLGTNMKYFPTFFAIIAAMLICQEPILRAETIPINVTSNPLWTNTNIQLSTLDNATIHNATGLWTFATGYTTDPGGYLIPNWSYDEWITDGLSGQLIGFVGQPGIDLNADPRTITQNDPRLFQIGTGSVNLSNLDGVLWLGINDDYGPGGLSDNSGSIIVQVDVTSTPEPSSLVLLGIGAVGLLGYAWRRR